MRDEAIAAALGALVEQAHRIARGYAQLALQIRPEGARAAIADASRAGDRVATELSASARHRLGARTPRELAQRWRALREAAGTRPQLPIAGPLDAVVAQLAESAARAGASLPPMPRAQRQRILLERIASTQLLACWGAAPAPAGRMMAMRAEFGHGLGDALGDAGPGREIEAATLRAQWGLLAAALDAAQAGCDPASLAQLASTTERLLRHYDESRGPVATAPRL
ncbi:MAG TPA: hypothetical protein VEA81_15790 [Burkholderiaceae bacterium]|nr:hypothetical protein [Burkholderiaceae bacterium]